MRVEYAGEPGRVVYSHVGYVSSAMAPYLDAKPPAQVSLPPTALAGLLLTALWIGIASRRMARAQLVGLAVCCTAGFAMVCELQPQWPRRVWRSSVAKTAQRTLVRLESLTDEVDTWAAKHGRPPSSDEWQALRLGTARDGWGEPFTYERLTKPGPDGQRYRITSQGSARRAPSAQFALTSTSLGADALYGTPDDSEPCTYLYVATGEHHGRGPRRSGASHAR
jgi:hypothetical protein